MNDRDKRAMEIAGEHDFDRGIDHSQPHERTDMEEALDRMDSEVFDDPEDVPDNEDDEFDEEDRYIGTMPTAREAQRYDGDFAAHEYYPNNEGYRPCRCEDYPCCGH